MEPSYYNFDLLIERTAERFRARVIDSPVGTASIEFDTPLSDLQLENYILRMGQVRQGKRLAIESSELKAVKQCGESLFDAVFAGDVYTCFAMSREWVREKNKGLRIRLHIEVPAFHDYPWELLYNSKTKQFLALSNDTPIVRYFELPFPEHPLLVEMPINILVMIASPEGFPELNVEDEWNKLKSAFNGLIERELVKLERLQKPTLGELQKALRRDPFHIFHFIGHGKFVVHQQDGVLLMEDEVTGRGRPVSGQYLGVLLHDHQWLRMVVLNACEGARTSQADPYAGVAQALVQQGIPAVIAMQFPIFEESAVEFAHEFYGAIADGLPVDTSISEARKALFTTGNETEWATPVLFMNSPDGRIFDLQEAQKTHPLKASEPVDEGEPDLDLEPVTDGSPATIGRKTSPRKRVLRKLASFWQLISLTLAVVLLILFLSIWFGRSSASPETPTDEAIIPVSMVSTVTDPASTVTATAIATASPTATFTETPVPSPTLYPSAIMDNKHVEMVLIPASSFVMGDDHGEGDEKPAHTVFMDAYYIDKYEVSNEQYEMCVLMEVCKRPIDVSSFQRLSYFGNRLFADYPVINVTYEMARAYCEDWRGDRAHLPFEAEWEKAARGTDHSVFPWGDEIGCQYANYREKGCERVRDTSPVTSFADGASDYGVYNMAGNVWEWVKDWYSPGFYLNSPDQNPTGPDHAVVGIYYMKRGGSFQDEWQRLRSSNREKNDPTNYGSNLGFRCARPISESFP